MKAKLLHDEASRQKRVREEAELGQTNKKAGTTNLQVQKNVKKTKNTYENESTIIYLGHIPHGFYERQMYTFFGQFGKVLKVKLFRNPKTKKSRGYAYLKFESPEVAMEVSSAMNGYFLQDRKLKCEIVPLDRQHEGMFLPPKKAVDLVISEDADDDDEDMIATVKPITEKQRKDQDKKQEKLIAMGINFDLSSVFTQSAAKPAVAAPAVKAAAKPTVVAPAVKATTKPTVAAPAVKAAAKPTVAIPAVKAAAKPTVVAPALKAAAKLTVVAPAVKATVKPTVVAPALKAAAKLTVVAPAVKATVKPTANVTEKVTAKEAVKPVVKIASKTTAKPVAKSAGKTAKPKAAAKK